MVLPICRTYGLRLSMALGLVLFSRSFCLGGLPTSDWLPADVKFHLSIVDYPSSKPLFERTGLGKLLRDQALDPFLEDLSDQLRSRARTTWPGLMSVDLGVDWKRFASVPSGEVAWAVLDVDDSPAALFLADVTAKAEEVDSVRDEIATIMAERDAEVQQIEVDGTTLTLYELPRRGETQAARLVHFVRNDFFVATHHVELAKRIVSRIGVEQTDNLSGSKSYRHVLEQCRNASKAEPQAVLYAVPFDCLDLAHQVAMERDVEIKQSPAIYRELGFDALKAVGVTIVVGETESDFRFQASLYAPKPWSKSMRMLDLRNGLGAWEHWIDQEVAACWSLNLHVASVYQNMGPFFDEVVAGGAEGAWEEVLIALREDEYGPQIDLEKEVFTFLQGPAVVIEKESLPVNPESPRVLLAIKTTDQSALRAGIKKAMQDDPLILKRDIGDTPCYYSVSQDDKDKLLWIICVAQGHLFMANDFDILTPVLQRNGGPPLVEQPDFMEAREYWNEKLSKEASASAFYRLDRWVEVRYELLRAGKRVSPRRTFIGMLSGFLGGELMAADEPSIDGSKLPPFSQVREYFGTLSAAFATLDSGWIVCGRVCR
ncbi:MAG: hypothetical protein ACODAD_06710 [Planctomycetota bacterium]